MGEKDMKEKKIPGNRRDVLIQPGKIPVIFFGVRRNGVNHCLFLWDLVQLLLLLFHL